MMTPNELGYSDVPCACNMRVLAVTNSDPLSGYPANVNVAAAFSYDVDLNVAGGIVRMIRAQGNEVRPGVPRWPIPWLVQAFPVGAMLPGVIVGGEVMLGVAEDRWAAPCSFTPGGA